MGCSPFLEMAKYINPSKNKEQKINLLITENQNKINANILLNRDC
jgi:hypothetical protein